MHQINDPYAPRRSAIIPLPFACVFAGAQNKNLEEEIADNDFNDSAPTVEDQYSLIPRKDNISAEEERIDEVRKWLTTLRRPPHMSDTTFTTFVRYATEFFVDGDRLWKKDHQGRHKLVIDPTHQWKILVGAHDQAGHKGLFATRATILDRFWWPGLQADIHWFVQTCHLCQERQL